MEKIFNFFKKNFLIIILILVIFKFKNNNIKENFSSDDTCLTKITCPKDDYVMSDDKKIKSVMTVLRVLAMTIIVVI